MTTIYLVDDSATMIMSTTEILKRSGFQVQSASNGLAALNELKRGLIITDQNMPGLTGIELIREARKLAQLRFTPILMLTTESQQAKRQEAKSAGATGWLVKPVGAKDLLAVIKQVLPNA